MDNMDRDVKKIADLIMAIETHHHFGMSPYEYVPFVKESSEGLTITINLASNEDRSSPELGVYDEGDWTFVTSKTFISCPDAEMRYRVIHTLPEFLSENFEEYCDLCERARDKDSLYEVLFAS